MTIMKPLLTTSLPPRAAKTLTGAVLGALLGFAGCSPQAVFLPSHDLDRPTDIAFSCLELDQAADPSTPAVLGAQPMDVCHPPGQKDPLFGGPVAGDGISRTFKTYAFVTNSQRGDVSVVDMSYCRSNDDACKQKALQPGAALVDLDPNTIGYGSAPVGEIPEVIDASQDGCRLVTANRGSCDLTLIDPAAMLTPRLTGGDLPTYARTFMVRTGLGHPLSVAPGEIAFVPQQTNVASPGRGPGQLCTTGVMPPPATGGTLAAPVGTPPATPEQRASWRAIVTFPSCDLVALVDLQTETILDSYRVRPGKNAKGDPTDVTLFHTGAEPSCPRTDCGAGAGLQADAGTTDIQPAAADGEAPSDDGGAPASDGGSDASAPVVSLDDAVPALQVRPMAIRPEGTRVYFGATNWSAVGALDITGDTLTVPSMGAITPLYATNGVMRLRLSVDRYAYVNGHLPKTTDGVDPNDPTKPELGRFVARTDDANLQYLYVIARDASVRTIDVSRPDPKECDIGIDPTAVSETDPRRKCFPFGASDNPPRLPQVPYLPGLRFPSAPQDVAFAYYWTDPSVKITDQAVNEQILNGAYAFVLTSGGGLFIINIDPEPRQTARVYYAPSGDPNQGPYLDIQPAPADPGNPAAPPALMPVAGLRRESPLPLPNTQRDPNVITYVPGLLTSTGPARVETANPITTSNGPLLGLFDATTTRENSLIVPFLSNGTLTAPTTAVSSYVFFPNPVTVLPQSWIIAWEPDITGTRNAGDIDRVHHLNPNSPLANLAFAITDNGGSFCTNGIFPGDTVTLTGCTTDASCGSPGRVCMHSTEARSSASGYAINGLCVKATKNDAATQSSCANLLRSFRRYEILPTTSDFDPAFKDKNAPQSTLMVVPKKAELPVIGTCGPTCPPAGRPDLMGYACEDGVNEGRCLMRCDHEDGVEDATCASRRPGSVCVDFRASEGHRYCADGAPLSDPGPLEDVCGLDQLISYSVSAGRTFVVSGSAVGRLDAGGSAEVRVPATAGSGGQGTGAAGAGGAGGVGGAGGMGRDPGAPPTTGTGYYQCAPDRSTPTVVARIPINLPRCTSPKIAAFNDLPQPTAAEPNPVRTPKAQAYKAIFTDSTVPSPNPCLVEYGPETVPLDGAAGGSTGSTGAGGAGGSAAGSTLGAAGPTYSAVFQNREIRFVLTNLETTIGDTVQIRFTVDGGSIGQQVAVAGDSAIGLPARVVVGPVPASDQTLDPIKPTPMPIGSMPADLPYYLPSDLPFLFVVDQRTNSGGRLATRGQILRVAPRISDTAPTPGYESALTSNSYFPIQ